MVKPAYYNEFDKTNAQWLRNLIAAGHIAPGDVDERSIEDVTPDDLKGYAQCHFFAGIGVWSYALRRVGWPDDRPVWTGSCPCQPFSTAGKGAGFDDERHLWPAWHWLIGERKPSVVFGEQVASNDGLAWLDLVQADMEGTGYAFTAVDTCSAGFGAPHIRQRLYFVGDTNLKGLEGFRRGHSHTAGQRSGTIRPATASSQSGGLVACEFCGYHFDVESLGRYGCPNCEGECLESESTGPVNGFWRDADWLYCRDGRWRPVEPGTFPLAHGATSRVGRLHGYGNAVNAEAAAGFIRAFVECGNYDW